MKIEVRNLGEGEHGYAFPGSLTRELGGTEYFIRPHARLSVDDGDAAGKVKIWKAKGVLCIKQGDEPASASVVRSIDRPRFLPVSVVDE